MMSVTRGGWMLYMVSLLTDSCIKNIIILAMIRNISIGLCGKFAENG